MSDKKIQIQTVVTGSQQAAADINRVGQAAERAMGRPTGTTGLAGTSAGAAKQLGKVAKEVPKVTRATGSMRHAVQNAAFQFQDMAVQAEMGVNATRIFSQQVPQLLGGFGAIGAVAGAVLGVGVPLAAALMRSGNEAEEAVPKVEELKEMLEEYAEALKKAASEKDLAKIEDWVEALDEEEDYYLKINKQLERQFKLQTKLLSLKEGADSAELSAEIEEIQADPNKSDLDKLREVAIIKEKDELSKTESEKAKLAKQAERDREIAEKANKEFKRQQADLDEIVKKRNDLEIKSKKLRSQAESAAKQGASLDDLQTELRTNVIIPGTGRQGLGPSQEQLDRVIAKRNKLEEKISAATKAAKNAPKLRDKAKQLEAEADSLKKGEAAQRSQRDSALRDREDTFSAAQNSKALAELGAEEIDRRYQARRRIRSSRTERRASEAEERERKEREDLARKEEERRDNARESRARDEAGVGREALRILNQSSSSLSGDAFQRGQAAVEEIVAKLQDGDQGGELDRLASLVEHLASAVQGKNKATDVKIDQLQQQIKNMRQPNK